MPPTQIQISKEYAVQPYHENKELLVLPLSLC